MSRLECGLQADSSYPCLFFLPQVLLNSQDAAFAPTNPFLLNARVMCSEERGAIFSETLVLWQELQVSCKNYRVRLLCFAFFAAVSVTPVEMNCTPHPKADRVIWNAGVWVPSHNWLVQRGHRRMAQGRRDSARFGHSSLHEIEQNSSYRTHV